MLKDVQLAGPIALLLQMTFGVGQMLHFGSGPYPFIWPGGKHQEVTL